MDEEPVVAELGTLVEGYAGAFERFKQASDPKDPKRAFIALFEALNWATSIDEHPACPAHPTLIAVRYVRARVHHRWSEAVVASDWVQVTAPGPMVDADHRLMVSGWYFEWSWREPEDLPEAWPNPSGEREYRARLAGKHAGDALHNLMEHFNDAVAAVPENPPNSASRRSNVANRGVEGGTRQARNLENPV